MKISYDEDKAIGKDNEDDAMEESLKHYQAKPLGKKSGTLYFYLLLPLMMNGMSYMKCEVNIFLNPVK